MCCFGFVIKHVLFLANCVFSVAGAALIGIGIAALVQLSEVLELIPVQVVPILTIVVGCIVLVVSMFGCCGAIKESKCSLIIYAIFMAILLSGSIALAYYIFNNLPGLESTVSGWLTDAFNSSANSQLYNGLEYTFECCGTTGAGSYNSTTIPDSCCPSGETCTLTNSYSGCIDLMTSYLRTFGGAIGGIIIPVIIVEAVAFVFAIYLVL